MNRALKILKAGTWLAGGVAVAVAYGFVNENLENRVIRKVDVTVKNQGKNNFLAEKRILERLKPDSLNPVGKIGSQVRCEEIRRVVLQMPEVADAGVFINPSGTVGVEITERTPICRILNIDGSGFYLDTEGRIMPLSNEYTAHVPVFTGNLRESAELIGMAFLQGHPELLDKTLLDECFELAAYLKKDKLMQHLTEHVVVNADGEFDVVPRFGSFKIRFGTINRLDQKTLKLKVFLKNSIGKADLKAYNLLDLRFKGQVVCRRQ